MDDVVAREEGLRRDCLSLIKQLSPREHQVLQQLSGGLGVKSISENLGLNQRTVEVYQANIKSKFGAGSMAEVVWVAIYAGIHHANDD